MGRWAIVGLGIGAAGLVVGGAVSLASWRDLEVVAPAGGETAAASEGSPVRVPPTTTTTVAPLGSTLSCRVADERVQGDPVADHAMVMIDQTNALPAHFVPPDLVPVPLAGFDSTDQIRQVVIADLVALRQGAEANRTPLKFVSGFRDYARQEVLFSEEVAEKGPDAAQETTARPGHSEHQLGTAIDVTDPNVEGLDVGFAQTSTGQWLAANAHRYGFVFSYPDVPAERRCYAFEPWHLRYVGRDIAGDVHESGLTLREWQAEHPSS